MQLIPDFARRLIRCSSMTLFLAGSIFPVAMAAASRQTLHFTMERYPGYFGEYCVEMQVGETLELVVRSPYPVRLNVHYHADDEAEYLLDERVENANPNSVSVLEEGEYCLQVTNVESRESRFDLVLEYEVFAPKARGATAAREAR